MKHGTLIGSCKSSDLYFLLSLDSRSNITYVCKARVGI